MSLAFFRQGLGLWSDCFIGIFLLWVLFLLQIMALVKGHCCFSIDLLQYLMFTESYCSPNAFPCCGTHTCCPAVLFRVSGEWTAGAGGHGLSGWVSDPVGIVVKGWALINPRSRRLEGRSMYRLEECGTRPFFLSIHNILYWDLKLELIKKI